MDPFEPNFTRTHSTELYRLIDFGNGTQSNPRSSVYVIRPYRKHDLREEMNENSRALYRKVRF